MTKKQLFDNVSELHEKYTDLMWYARSGVNFDNHSEDLKQAVLKSRQRIEEMYPEDIEDYEENPVWRHGFNSGIVAAIRFIYTLDDEGLKEAIENFPELDT